MFDHQEADGFGTLKSIVGAFDFSMQYLNFCYEILNNSWKTK